MAKTNGYVDNLTVKDYKFLELQLSYRLDTINKEIEQGESTVDDYVKLRFLQHKVKRIIKKYEKPLDN